MATTERAVTSGGMSTAQEEEDEEWEEEEQLVLVELSGIIDPDFLTKCENKCKILGIDTDQPIIQVDRHVFAGQYEADTLGTCVIFEEHAGQDSEAEEKPQLKYCCHTVKKLKMTRTFLSDKKEGEEPSTGVEMMQIKETESFRRPSQICSYNLPNRSIEGAEMSEGIEGGAPIEIPSHSSGSEGEDSDDENADMSHELEEPASELQEFDPENPEDVSEWEPSGDAGPVEPRTED